VRNVVTTIEREVALSQARVTERQIVLISVFLYLVFRRPLRNITRPPIVAIINTQRATNAMKKETGSSFSTGISCFFSNESSGTVPKGPPEWTRTLP
jgi:hypothetical protein